MCLYKVSLKTKIVPDFIYDQPTIQPHDIFKLVLNTKCHQGELHFE